MFLSDSTSAKMCDRMAKRLVSLGVGPFCVDINLGRLLARNHHYSGSAITAIRQARNAGFDAQSYVLALGFSDILNNMQDPRFVGNPVPTVVSILEEVLTEIGTDRTVGILNLYGATAFSGARALLFNEGLGQIAATCRTCASSTGRLLRARTARGTWRTASTTAGVGPSSDTASS